MYDNKSFDRTYIMLMPESGGYTFYGKKPFGKALLELSNGKGRVTVNVQSLKPILGGVYRVYLISSTDKGATGVSAGVIEPDQKGKATASWFFDPTGPGGSSIDYFSINIVAVIAKSVTQSQNEIIAPLVGYKDGILIWKSGFKEWKPDQQMDISDKAASVDKDNSAIIPKESSLPPDEETSLINENIAVLKENIEAPNEDIADTKDSVEAAGEEGIKGDGINEDAALDEQASKDNPCQLTVNDAYLKETKTESAEGAIEIDEQKILDWSTTDEGDSKAHNECLNEDDTLNDAGIAADSSGCGRDFAVSPLVFFEYRELKDAPECEGLTGQSLEESLEPSAERLLVKSVENGKEQEKIKLKSGLEEPFVLKDPVPFDNHDAIFREKLRQFSNYADYEHTHNAPPQPQGIPGFYNEQDIQKLLDNRPHMAPFPPGHHLHSPGEIVIPGRESKNIAPADIKWIRITQKDLHVLPRPIWKLENNPFVSLPYMRYNHYLLGISIDKKIRAIYFCVPGQYSNKDKYRANMLGFTEFFPIDGAGPREGGSGYWVMIV